MTVFPYQITVELTTPTAYSIRVALVTTKSNDPIRDASTGPGIPSQLRPRPMNRRVMNPVLGRMTSDRRRFVNDGHGVALAGGLN
jgi:hypothetical protein